MWEPRVIYQQSYIYTTANIIRSREPLRYKTFPQSFPFFNSFHPQLLSLTHFKNWLLSKKVQTMHCKLRWHLEINGQSSHTFFSAMGRRLGLLPCLPPISGKQLPTSPWLPSSQWPLCTLLDLSSMSLQDVTGHQLNLMRLAPLRTKTWSEVPSRDRWSLSPSHGNFCCPIGLQKGRSSSLIV